MARQSIPILNLQDYLSEDETRKDKFVQELGEALIDIGFFSLTGHGIELDHIDKAYAVAEEFFTLPAEIKAKYENQDGPKQRGHIPFGIEAAKGNPTPDLKEFWQTGRTLSENNPHFDSIPPNLVPTPTYQSFNPPLMDCIKRWTSLVSCYWRPVLCISAKKKTVYRKYGTGRKHNLTCYSLSTIAEDADPNAVRAAQHEDINFITLLVGATADGLEVMDHDGSWIAVEGKHDHIIVDTGDMIQNITNGFYKSITHRVVNPEDAKGDRYSIPSSHPRPDVDLFQDLNSSTEQAEKPSTPTLRLGNTWNNDFEKSDCKRTSHPSQEVFRCAFKISLHTNAMV